MVAAEKLAKSTQKGDSLRTGETNIDEPSSPALTGGASEYSKTHATAAPEARKEGVKSDEESESERGGVGKDEKPEPHEQNTEHRAEENREIQVSAVASRFSPPRVLLKKGADASPTRPLFSFPFRFPQLMVRHGSRGVNTDIGKRRTPTK